MRSALLCNPGSCTHLRQQGRAHHARSATPDFSQRGIWELEPPWTEEWDLGDSSDLQDRLAPSLQLRVTGPGAAAAASTRPHPVLLFFNGFLARSGWYHLLMERAASWGYMVVQYDSPKLNEVAPAGVENEVLLFEPLLAWLEAANASHSRLQGRLDLSQLVATGHSRGGKLATLLFSDAKLGSRVRAAYLVDPVDLFSPSAVEALEHAGRRVGVTGGGVWGPLNPPLVNYQAFFDAAAPGSWLVRLPGVSHLQFCDAGQVGNWWLDRLDRFPEWMRSLILAKGLDALLALSGERDAGKLLDALGGDPGKLSDLRRLTRQLARELQQGGPAREQAAEEVREGVAQLTAAPMLAWFHRELQATPPPQPDAAFLSWVQQEEGKKGLSFCIKGRSEDNPA